MIARFLLFILLCLPSLAWATISVPSDLNASRTSCVAPCAIMFDGVGTDDSVISGTTREYHDLLFKWDFGDPGQGSWGYGTTLPDKNVEEGPLAVHVFDPSSFPDDCSGNPCKQYTVSLTVINAGGTFTTETEQVTIYDPDDTVNGWGPAKTWCFANASDFTGCPSGATQVPSTSSFTSALATCGSTSNSRQCLFRGGDSFAASSTSQLGNDGPGYIGGRDGFGTGRPVVNFAGSATPISLGLIGSGSDPNTTSVRDWRIGRINFDFTSAGSGSRVISRWTGGSTENILVYKSSLTNGKFAYAIIDPSAAWGTNPPLGNRPKWFFYVEVNCSIGDYGGLCHYGGFDGAAILGGDWYKQSISLGEHLFRTTNYRKMLVAHNRFRHDAASTGQVMKMNNRMWTHSSLDPSVSWGGAQYDDITGDYMPYAVVRDNHFIGGDDDQLGGENVVCHGDNPNPGSELYGLHQDFIIEHNHFQRTTYSNGSPIQMNGSRVTIRNNTFKSNGQWNAAIGHMSCCACPGPYSCTKPTCATPIGFAVEDWRVHNNSFGGDQENIMSCGHASSDAEYTIRNNITYGSFNNDYDYCSGAQTETNNYFSTSVNPFVDGTGTYDEITDYELDPGSGAYSSVHDVGWNYITDTPSTGEWARLDAGRNCRPDDTEWDIGAWEADADQLCLGIEPPDIFPPGGASGGGRHGAIRSLR